MKNSVHTYLGDNMSIYIQLLFASFFWGSNVVLMKLFLGKIPFLFLATIRVFLSVSFLGIYLIWKKISLQYGHQGQIFIIGTLAIYLNFFFTFIGMNEVKGIDNAFMNALAPAFTFLFGVLLLKQKGSFKEYLAIGFTLFAFLLSIHFRIFDIKRGFWYLFFGMVLYMLANVFIQKWQLGRSLVFSFYELLYGFLLLLIHCLWSGQIQVYTLFNVSLGFWFLFILISGVGFAYIQVVYIKAIADIGALKTSFFLSLNPIFTYVESLVILKEKFDWIHFLGFIILAFAIYLITNKKEEISLPHNNE